MFDPRFDAALLALLALHCRLHCCLHCLHRLHCLWARKLLAIARRSKVMFGATLTRDAGKASPLVYRVPSV